MTELSPAAQAIYEAAIEQSEYPNDAEWVVINTLRAAADYAHRSSYAHPLSPDWGAGVRDAARRLLAIADELEGE